LREKERVERKKRLERKRILSSKEAVSFLARVPSNEEGEKIRGYRFPDRDSL